MSIQFVNFTEDEFLAKKLLYRYMPLEYALKTLNDKEIWFANPKVWKDPFEKRFIGAKISHGTKVADFPWKGKVYCFCTTQTATSEAYWKAYSRDQIGVELKIRRQALLDVLKGISNKCDIYIGRVEYMKTKDIIWRDLNKIPFSYQDHFTLNDKMCARLLLLKRIAFTYEDEVRIMIVQKERDNDKSGIGVK